MLLDEAFFLPQDMNNDILRFGMLTIGNFEDDKDWKDLMTTTHSHLSKTIGNFIHRILSFIQTKCGGIIPIPDIFIQEDKRLQDELKNLPIACDKCMDDFDFAEYKKIVWRYIDLGNKYLEEQKPWKIEDERRMHTVIYNVTDYCRKICLQMQPLLPHTMKIALDLMSIPSYRRELCFFDDTLEFGVPVPKPILLFPPLSERKL